MRVIHSIAFIFIYLWEVVYSTMTLTRYVLRPRMIVEPRFIHVPLDLKGEFPRFLFACLVSMTPGTLSVAIDQSRGTLLVHFLDCNDPLQAVSSLKRSIERPLLRIFPTPASANPS